MQGLSGEKLRKDHASISEQLAWSRSMQPLASNNDINQYNSTVRSYRKLNDSYMTCT